VDVDVHYFKSRGDCFNLIEIASGVEEHLQLGLRLLIDCFADFFQPGCDGVPTKFQTRIVEEAGQQTDRAKRVAM
jgi:hypothetical protein